ncbi:hypothetical protein JCGZ_17771 [Jatropha curcas]|uniref:Angiotensin-converting enzyme 2 n=1 Tax=Jatropha curcas TaxID=180498 RepID=A0A067JUU8_JATCU|nr:uncharacterized protein LOC105644619 [Jatropha curcas]KDP26613.1 hypothetical protein JCGZ_17771 [Jatropha curcas]
MSHHKIHNHHQQDLLPCLHCNPHSYIRMVHQLIERCLLLHLSRDQCIKVLEKHANVRPLVTLTVWRELQKENRDFFEAYSHSISSKPFPNRFIKRVPRLARMKQWK